MPVKFDEKVGYEYVYLVWGLTPHKLPELIAICTTEEIAERYMEGDIKNRHKVVTHEKAYLDHAYGNNMLKLVDAYIRGGGNAKEVGRN